MESAELTAVAAPVGPVEQAQRISSLDALRGFALLGILLMNIVGFAMIFAAYDDPSATGGPATGANLWIWIVMHVLAEGRSEEHTSELQSHVNLVCRLLLVKKD